MTNVNIEMAPDTIHLSFTVKDGDELRSILKILASNRKDSTDNFMISHPPGHPESAQFIRGALLGLDVKDDNVCITPTPK